MATTNIKFAIVAAATLITAFGTGIVVGHFVLGYAYAYDFENSTAYQEVMNATRGAANYTEGMMISQYIEDIIDMQIEAGMIKVMENVSS